MLGEGVGGMFMGGSSLLIGAPGAALVYVVLAVVLWPVPGRGGRSVADEGVLGGRWTRVGWLVLWVGTALFELTAVNYDAGVPGAQLVNIGEGEPGMVAAVNRTVGGLVAGQGLAFAVVFGVAQLLVGVLVLVPRARRLAVCGGIGLAVFVGLFGQDLGGLLTGQGTDPGTGPVLVLLALTLWPRAAVR